MLILVTKKGSHPFWEIGRYLLVSSTHLPGPQHVASTPRKYRRHVRKTWIRFSHGHHGFSPTFWGWRSSNFPFFSSVLVRITMTFTISGWSQWGFTGNRWSAFGSLRFGEVCPWLSRGVCVSNPIPQFLHCVNGYMSPQKHVGSGLLSPACHAMSLGFATSYPSTEVLLDEADREKGPFDKGYPALWVDSWIQTQLCLSAKRTSSFSGNVEVLKCKKQLPKIVVNLCLDHFQPGF